MKFGYNVTKYFYYMLQIEVSYNHCAKYNVFMCYR